MPVSFTANRATILRTDNDGDGVADAGDVLRHTLTFTNTGDTDATAAVVNDLLGGSTETGLMNISPIAFNDAFTAVGNTTLRVGGAANIGSGPSSTVAGNLLANDVGSTIIGVGALAADDVTGFTLDTVTNGVSTMGGTFNIFADGSFNYVSEAGDQGVDTFTYTIRDAGIDGIAGNADDTTSTATVSITITGQVWYVAQGASGNGTSANPFGSITALNTANVDGANDYIYVQGSVSGPLVMEQGEHLIGTGSSLDVAGFHLADAATRSTITNNTAGFTVTLAGGGTGNNEIAGIQIVSTGGTGNHALTGTSFGNLTINNTTVDASGQGLILQTGTIVAGSTGLVSTDSDGGTNNVSLTGITGTLALGSGALSGATGAAFNVSGGSVTTTYSGNVSQATAGQALVNVAGGHTGTLTFSTGTLSATNGTGLQFDNADGNYNFNGTNTLNGGDAGVDIVNGSGGNFVFSSSSSITNPTGIAINVNGGAGNIDYNGTISHTANTRAISVQNHSGGTVSFDGTVSATGSSDGILLATNSGANINFTNTLTINASGANFDASGGGTVTATAAGSTISSGSATAFSMTGTTIGAAGITFQSIAANGAVNGILLNGTGSTGFFLVTGDGSQTSGRYDRDGSGGTIQLTTQDAVSLTNAFNVTLRQMNLTNAGWDGVGSSGGGNIVLSAVDINHPGNLNPASNGSTGNASGFGGGNGWYAQNITGTNLFDNNSRVFNWQSSQSNGVVINNTNTNFTSFVVDHALFSTSATGAAGFHANLNGTTAGTVNIIDSEFTLIDQNAAQILHNGSGIVNTTIQGNNFHDADATSGDGNNGLFLALAGSGTLNFRVGGLGAGDGNTFNNLNRLQALAGAITVNAATTNQNGSRLNGWIEGNTLTNIVAWDAISIGIEANGGTQGTHTISVNNNTASNIGLMGLRTNINSVNGGSITATNLTIANNNFSNTGTSPLVTNDSRTGIEIETNWDNFASGGDMVTNLLLQNNTVSNNGNNSGIGDTVEIIARGGDVGTNHTMNLTMLGNNLTNTGGTNVLDIYTSSGATGTGITLNVDLNSDNIGANANNTTNNAGAAGSIELRNNNSALYRIENLGANPVDSFVSARNNNDTVVHTGTIGSTGAVTLPTAPSAFLLAPPPPPAPPAPPAAADGDDKGDATGGEFVPPPPTGDPAPPPSPSGEQPIVVDDGVLSQAELDLIVGAAIDRWAAAGATEGQLAAMRAATFSVEDISGLALAMSTGSHITIDFNAAGFSWFVDATPGEDGEYSGSGTRLTAAPDTQAGVRIDLLTTIMHELGHQIGLDDDYRADERDELMYGTINPGERRLPGNDDLTGASGAPLSGIAFALSPVNIGTVPAGRTVTIQWDSTVNAFTNQIVPTFNNTSSLSGGNFVTTTSNTNVLGPASAPLALDSLTLGNLVFLDANNNGTFDGSDTGINGVALTLFADTNANGVFDSGIDVQLATTITAGGGLYSFANLAPGDYIVRVDAANFTGGGALLNRPTATGASDPDDNTNNDDNGANAAGGIVVSQAITLTQNGETTADGTGQLDINNTLDFGFIELNDPPMNTVPGTQTINEDATLTFTGGAAISVNDVDVGAGNLTVTLSVNHGVLTLSGTAGLAFGPGDGTNDATMTFTGTQAAVNAALNGLVYTPTGDFNGSDTLTVTTNDNGNTGSDPGTSGGANDEQDSDTVTINITAINDAPTVVGGTTETSATINEDTPLALGQSISSLFGGHYSDAADNQVPNGGASSPGAFSGVAVTANASSGATGQWQYSTNGGGSWQDIGPVTDATARLYNPGTLLRFNPALNYNGSEPTLTAHLVDNSGAAITDNAQVNLSGGGATGGTTRYSSGIVDLGGSVTVVNDAPIVTFGSAATGGETLVNTTVSGVQTDPSVAALSGGGHVVAWSGEGTGDAAGIFVQRYDAAGAPLGGETLVNGTTAGTQAGPSVAALSGGDYVVAWQGNGTGDADGIFVQRYNPFGIPQGAETLVNTGATAGAQINPSVAALADGGYVVVWQSPDATGAGIFAQRYDAMGGPQGGLIAVNAVTAGEQQLPDVIGLAGGGFAVTWFSDHEGSGQGVYVRRFDALGAGQGNEVRANTFTTNDQSYSSVGALQDGGYVVAWESLSQDGSGYGIYAQRYDAAGVPVGGEFRVNTSLPDNQEVPTVAGLEDGGFVITWRSNLQDGNGHGVYAQRYDAAGATVGVETLINTTTAGSQQNPDVAALPNSSYVVAWQGNGSGDSGGVFTQLQSTAYVATEQVALSLKGRITISDADAGAAVVTATLSVGYGVLNVSEGGSGATVVSGNGTGTVNLSGTIAQLNALLNSDATSVVTFTANTDLPPASTALTLTVDDGGATGSPGALQGTETVTININAINDSPVVSLAATGSSTEQVAGTVDATATISDADLDSRNGGNGDYAGSALIVGNNLATDVNDLFNVGPSGAFTVNGGNLEAGGLVFGTIQGGGNGSLLIINFTSSGTTATTALVNAVAQSIQYTYTGDTPPATIDVFVKLADGAPDNAGQGSTAGNPAETFDVITLNITDTAESAPPVVDLNDAGGGIDNSANYAENDGPVVLANGLVVTDADDTNIESASVRVTTGFIANFDYLTVNGATGPDTLMGINFNYSAATGILTLTGSATLADYQAVLRQVGFESTSDTPGTTRTISWTVNDGSSNSNPAALTTITVTPINDEPTLTATGLNPTYTEGAAAADLFGTVAASTIESGQTFVSVTLTVTNVTDGADEILRIGGTDVALTDANAVVIGGLTATVALASGTATVTVTGTQTAAALQALIDGLGYRNDSQNPTDADRVVTITQAQDSGGGTSPDDNVATLSVATTVDIVPVDDPATASADAAATNEAASVTFDVVGNDADIDGPAPSVSAINGAAVTVGTPVALLSGALVTLNANGTLTYNPNSMFNATPAPGSGASNTQVPDSFTYTLAGAGGGTATVTMTITGVDSNDTLLGTLAADALSGGIGDDSYFVEDSGDSVTEAAGQGYDIVYAASDYTLAAGQSVEKLGTVNNFATTAINLTGNELDNFVTGNAGDNVLDGGGGIDLLIGREGDDSYFVDSNDVVIEFDGPGFLPGQGYDIVYARTDYTLAAGVSVELLATADNLATTAINLTGNELNNYLTGNAGNNVLDGGGGSDLLYGRAGDDTYYVEAGDTVLEFDGPGFGPNQGHDTVYARTDFALGAGTSVEVLAAVDPLAIDSIDLFGNEIDNHLIGNAGCNWLNGGAGSDTLEGLGATDVFAFTTALGAGNVDTIVDFGDGPDMIALDASVFTGLAVGALDAGAFVLGTAAQDADDRIIYDGATGRLYFDADGNGGGAAAVLFAIVQPGTVVSASDFFVF